jgi:hypothetical protein
MNLLRALQTARDENKALVIRTPASSPSQETLGDTEPFLWRTMGQKIKTEPLWKGEVPRKQIQVVQPGLAGLAEVKWVPYDAGQESPHAGDVGRGDLNLEEELEEENLLQGDDPEKQDIVEISGDESDLLGDDT